jgi:type I restriction enzyme R subunit
MPGGTEADTCRQFVLPKLQAAGWDDDRISEQRTFTDGRIVVAGDRVRRRPQKRADYLLSYTRDFVIAVVEAKAAYRSAGDGLQQAKDYAEILGLEFCYATNGREIIEFDFTTGAERQLPGFPTPEELWRRYRHAEHLADDEQAQRLLTPYHSQSGRRPRYYQEIAINRTVQAILQGQRRILLCMATGIGQTVVAFQVCWKLWSARRDRAGDCRRSRILYLTDRNILIDKVKEQESAPFGDIRCRTPDRIVTPTREKSRADTWRDENADNRGGATGSEALRAADNGPHHGRVQAGYGESTSHPLTRRRNPPTCSTCPFPPWTLGSVQR